MRLPEQNALKVLEQMKMTIAFLYIGKDVLKVIIVQMRMRQDNVIQMMRDVTLGL